MPCSISEVAAKRRFLFLVMLLIAVSVVRGQQAVSSINQARLFTTSSAPGTGAFGGNNGRVATDQSDSSNAEDESFGTQIILKSQARPHPFSFFGDASAFYTNNVDLRRSDTRSDVFVAANAGAAWRPVISRSLLAEISVTTSVFRYDRANELDFERIAAGAGLSWIVPRARGIVAFARYDFTELLDSRSDELLQDHELTLGAQKAFVFARTHFLTTGLSGVLARAVPRSQEREQGGPYATYHLQITRSAGVDLLYRYAAQVYPYGSRLDHNQTLSLAIGIAPNRWTRISASLSGVRNDSSESAFAYGVFNAGGGFRFDVKF